LILGSPEEKYPLFGPLFFGKPERNYGAGWTFREITGIIELLRESCRNGGSVPD
jgi:hypothetical protein